MRAVPPATLHEIALLRSSCCQASTSSFLGYQNRRAAVPAEFADRIVPGGNGEFRPTVVSDSQVVGTWKHLGHGMKRTVAATQFSSSFDQVTGAIAQVCAALP